MLLCAVAILLMGCGNGKETGGDGSGVKPSENNEGMAAEKPVHAVYVDLGLPSGTLWKTSNEWNSSDDHGYYTYEAAVRAFGNSFPTKVQLEELNTKCTWTWSDSKKGYNVKGSNGNSIFLPAAGFRNCDGDVYNVGSLGDYWSSTPRGLENAWLLGFFSTVVYVGNYNRCYGRSVRLVQAK